MGSSDRSLVLVVDDHADTRHMLLEALRIAHVRAIGCESGERALAVARRWRPALVITDMHMGDGMDGADLVRALAGLSTPPMVIGVSGDAALELPVQRLFRAFFQKPADPLAIAAMVVRLLRHRRWFAAG